MVVQAAICLLLTCLQRTVARGSELWLEPTPSTISSTRVAVTQDKDPCVPCEWLFSKLEEGPDGFLRQDLQLQLRGEPKSGTHFMYSLAAGVIHHTCMELQAMYGSETCRIEVKRDVRVTMIFEPSLAEGDDICPCDGNIHRVSIGATSAEKHGFPIARSCPWWHTLLLPNMTEGCWSVGGREVKNESDIWGCMQEASCKFQDDRLQFAAMRDPRAVAVSSYFHAKRVPNYTWHPAHNHTLDETVLMILPQLCHWTTLRHILFEGLMSNTTELFWYEDAREDPRDWHYRWALHAGLNLPVKWIERMVESLGKETWSSTYNRHNGGAAVSEERFWTDEVSPGIREEIDSILRTWLPAVLLARFQVPPA
ncbi:unnamed protein product [Ectocarpus sp. 4 AP-2014]